MKKPSTVLVAASVLAGSLLYLGFSWIPILGPLIVGGVVGWLVRSDPRKSFRYGLSSGTIGFIALMGLIYQAGLLDVAGLGFMLILLLAWVMLLWHLAAIFFAGVGAAMGSMLYTARNMLHFEEATREPISSAAVTYVICPSCGSGVREDFGECGACGIRLEKIV